MQVGVVFPQTEIGADPAGVRDYTQAAEEMGFTHILAYDHVIGADLTNRPDWKGPYTSETMFHEPLVLFSYMAGITQRIEFVTGVIILPQRQTVLVAKQAAEVDVLSGGRLRLGVGIGWNDVEYVALNENFRNRGERMEEQIALMRELWTEPVINFTGRWHTVPEAGLNPLPVQRPIPIWIGANADVGVERAGRIADGWFPQMQPGEQAQRQVDLFRNAAAQAGRDPQSVGIEARITLRDPSPDAWRAQLDGWRTLGATHASVNTMGINLQGPQAHIDMLRHFREVMQ